LTEPKVVELISSLVIALLAKSLPLVSPVVTLRLLKVLLSLPESYYHASHHLIDIYSGFSYIHYLHINENERVLFKFITLLSTKLGQTLPALSEETVDEMRINWNKFVDYVVQSIISRENELPEQHLKALINTKLAFGPLFQIESQNLNQLTQHINKFADTHAELVDLWKSSL